ncbi:MAG: 4Fe-4S binding protein [Dehalococcoidales bacterium]
MGVIINLLKCTGCGSCTYLCPAGVLVLDDLKCRIQAGCTSCGECVDACSFKAIKLEGQKTGKGHSKKRGN